ncbi:DNA fragmentation factor subunit beta isoform X2 [Myotis daubentonii]|uniref:DNA fragmentation factor subunit beta isoform X2 n=1 Tax=Myotis daubentonii TaxID=98922 RepID=UPI002873A450|nr:DNA fragmentation factor subunit beta isoform X2 [Myotis daubentonii]
MSVPRKLKTFKLRALHSPQKFGIAGRSCQEVLQKGCLHFQVPVPGSRLCLWEDGTELTADGFWSVPDNAELVLLTKGQAWQGYVSDISRFLSVFHRPHVGVIQAARQLLSDEQAPLRQKLLADLLHTVSENIAAETRAEDPPWFEGELAHVRGGRTGSGGVRAGRGRHGPEAQGRAVQRQLLRQGRQGRRPALHARRLVLLPGSFRHGRLCVQTLHQPLRQPGEPGPLQHLEPGPHNREEAHGDPRAGGGGRRAGRQAGGLGVLLQPALHLREPQVGAHRLPQEDHPQAQL